MMGAQNLSDAIVLILLGTLFLVLDIEYKNNTGKKTLDSLHHLYFV